MARTFRLTRGGSPRVAVFERNLPRVRGSRAGTRG